MTKRSPQSNQLRKDLAKIHIARKELCMADDAYRVLLADIQPGATSSADLNQRNRAKLLARFRALGWKPRTSARPRTKVTADHAQDKMIRGLWLELADMGVVRDRSEQALARFVKRQTGCARLEWINGKQASDVIEALKSWRDREGQQDGE